MSHHYLTRLFTTMSADEMTEDPTFAFNPDAEPVGNVHVATAQIYQCNADGYYDYGNLRIVTQSGLVLEVAEGVMKNSIQREGGQTIRKGDEPAAAKIEQYLTSGAPEAATDNTPGIVERNDGTGLPPVGQGGDDADDGCGCQAVPRRSSGAGFVLLLAALGLSETRRRAPQDVLHPCEQGQASSMPTFETTLSEDDRWRIVTSIEDTLRP